MKMCNCVYKRKLKFNSKFAQPSLAKKLIYK